MNGVGAMRHVEASHIDTGGDQIKGGLVARDRWTPCRDYLCVPHGLILTLQLSQIVEFL